MISNHLGDGSLNASSDLHLLFECLGGGLLATRLDQIVMCIDP